MAMALDMAAFSQRPLTEAEQELAMRRADGALAAAGMRATDPRARQEIREALAGKVSFDSVIQSIVARARQV